MGFAHTFGHDVLPLRCTELSATKQRVRELSLLQTQSIRLKEFIRFAEIDVFLLTSSFRLGWVTKIGGLSTRQRESSSVDNMKESTLL